MNRSIVVGTLVACFCIASCGGDSKSAPSDRNDALGETMDQVTAADATSLEHGTEHTGPHATGQTNVNSVPHETVEPSNVDASVSPSPDTTSEVPASQDAGEDRPSDTFADAGPVEASASGTRDDGGTAPACGARAGDTCTDTEYCAYAPGQLCGQADAQATCKPRPETCTADYTPVCGCDGMTYGNACTAAMAGMGVYAAGECQDDCATVQCFRAITCAESCTSEVVQAGCCPCPDGLIDTSVECSDQ